MTPAERLAEARHALRRRSHFAPYEESPRRSEHPPGAHARGRAAFEALLGEDFPLEGGSSRVGVERSPYTGESLGIRYPKSSAADLVQRAAATQETWAAVPFQGRIELTIRLLERLSEDCFFNTYATMHTTGQPFLLAFAGSGASALERGLEAVAMAAELFCPLPEEAMFERHFGPGPTVRLRKRYQRRPLGVGVVIACGSYPAWNAWPAWMANLVTGNPTLLKPHPRSTLPVARAVRIARELLAEEGLPPDIVGLAVDDEHSRIARELVQQGEVGLVDFTGGPGFGRWLERSLPGKRVYTETSGCNAVLLESVRQLEPVLATLAHAFCYFSGQMCTAPQNLYLPEEGVRTDDGMVPAAEVEQRWIAAIDGLCADGERAAATCGALCDPELPRRIEAHRQSGELLRDSAPYAHPRFPQARTATPLLFRSFMASQAHTPEHFGPIGAVIRAPDPRAALQRMAADAGQHGAIATYVYSTDAQLREEAERLLWPVGASIGFNLRRQIPVHYAAAFSDFHVSGLNPAGNATLTDPAFVAGRCRTVQSKLELES